MPRGILQMSVGALEGSHGAQGDSGNTWTRTIPSGPVLQLGYQLRPQQTKNMVKLLLEIRGRELVSDRAGWNLLAQVTVTTGVLYH